MWNDKYKIPISGCLWEPELGEGKRAFLNIVFFKEKIYGKHRAQQLGSWQACNKCKLLFLISPGRSCCLSHTSCLRVNRKNHDLLFPTMPSGPLPAVKAGPSQPQSRSQAPGKHISELKRSHLSTHSAPECLRDPFWQWGTHYHRRPPVSPARRPQGLRKGKTPGSSDHNPQWPLASQLLATSSSWQGSLK